MVTNIKCYTAKNFRYGKLSKAHCVIYNSFLIILRSNKSSLERIDPMTKILKRYRSQVCYYKWNNLELVWNKSMSVKSVKEEDHTHELFTKVHLPKTLSTEEAIGETLPEVHSGNPLHSTRQLSTHWSTVEYCNAVVLSNTAPRVTSVPALPYAYFQSEAQTLNVLDQSQVSSIHPPHPLKLGTVTSASHLAKLTAGASVLKMICRPKEIFFYIASALI